VYLREAHSLYSEWGAAAKVRHLEEHYRGLLEQQGSTLRVTASRSGGSGAEPWRYHEALDISTVVKAAHAITAEIVLDDLLKRILKIAMENAGARRGLLLEEREGELFIAAEGSVDSDEVTVFQATPLSSSAHLCSSAVVNYVCRTATSLVIADAALDERFAADAYITLNKSRSILCMPIVHQGKLGAVLYLENNLTSNAFTPERTEIIRILSAQAAISLENARLFDRMKQEIEQRHRAEEGLRVALAEVETLKNQLEAENVYLRRDMIANVSHDLRSPLAALHGYLETLLIKEQRLTRETRRNYLEIALRQSERLGTLVSELFELAKLDVKDVEINPEPLQLSELAHDVLQKFKLAAEKKRVTLELEARPDLPYVRGDIGLIERVLDNLIENALEHTEAGGEIRITMVRGDKKVAVQVADTGTGMPPEEIPHIFERSYRVDKSRASRSGGAGLGLAIAKRILELHGSEIKVESQLNIGTRFSFALPVSGI
jgi:signal transduction histidine kinase